MTGWEESGRSHPARTALNLSQPSRIRPMLDRVPGQVKRIWRPAKNRRLRRQANARVTPLGAALDLQHRQIGERVVRWVRHRLQRRLRADHTRSDDVIPPAHLQPGRAVCNVRTRQHHPRRDEEPGPAERPSSIIDPHDTPAEQRDQRVRLPVRKTQSRCWAGHRPIPASP